MRRIITVRTGLLDNSKMLIASLQKTKMQKASILYSPESLSIALSKKIDEGIRVDRIDSDEMLLVNPPNGYDQRKVAELIEAKRHASETVLLVTDFVVINRLLFYFWKEFFGNYNFPWHKDPLAWRITLETGVVELMN